MERFKLCRSCQHMYIDAATGLFCGVTGSKPSFTNTCSNYVEDLNKKERLQFSEMSQMNVMQEFRKDFPGLFKTYLVLASGLFVLFSIRAYQDQTTRNLIDLVYFEGVIFIVSLFWIFIRLRKKEKSELQLIDVFRSGAGLIVVSLLLSTVEVILIWLMQTISPIKNFEYFRFDLTFTLVFSKLVFLILLLVFSYALIRLNRTLNVFSELFK